MVNFDEHGGTFDHVPPPSAPPPELGAPAGQLGFTFDRAGLRVPAIAISAWVPERTVIDGEYRNTSVLQTIRRRWELGPRLTARDAAAPDIVPVLSLDRPRPPEEWPDVVPQPVPAFQPQLLPRDAKLAALPRAALFAVLELGKASGRRVPELASDEDVLRVDGLAIITEIFGDMFPHLHGE